MRTRALSSLSGSTSAYSWTSTDSGLNPLGSKGSLNVHGDHSGKNTDGDSETPIFGDGSIIWTRGSQELETSNCGLRQRIQRGCAEATRKENLQKVFPILKWAPEYSTRKLVSDIIAGLTVGLTILPQGLAYAQVASLPPVYGLYSGFVGCFVYILFGGSKVITVGPNAIQCILTWKYVHGKSPEYAVFLCFTSGIIFLFMYICRLGFIANFISTPVISGFTSAVAVTIVSTQVKGLLGLSFPAEGFLPTFEGLIENLRNIQPADAYLSLGCCSFLFFLMYLRAIFGWLARRSVVADQILWFISTSRNAIVIIACTVYVSLKYPKQPFTLVGHIVPGLPELKPPPFSIFHNETNTTSSFWDIIKEEADGVIVMPLLGLMGHMTIAKAFAGGERVDPAPEILSIGISNVIASFFSSMPIAGSFSRTTVNAMSGAESPAGGIVTGTIVILALQFLTPYFYCIPKASLASVVCCSVVFMVEFKPVATMWKAKKMDLIPWALTVGVSLFVGLEYGIAIGLISSAMFLLYYAARPRVRLLQGFTSKSSEFILVQLDRSLTFPSVDYITDVIGKQANRYGKQGLPIVIDCHHIQFADFTAAMAISEMVNNFSKVDLSIIFWKLKPSILRIVSRVMEESGSDFTHCRSENELEAAVDKLAAERSMTAVQTDSGPSPQTPTG